MFAIPPGTSREVRIGRLTTSAGHVLAPPDVLTVDLLLPDGVIAVPNLLTTYDDGWIVTVPMPGIGGEYHLQVRDSSGSTVRYERIWGGYRAPPGATTRLDLVRRAARLCKELIVLTATEDGTMTAFVDAVELPKYAVGSLAHRECLCVSGHPSNVGEMRVVALNNTVSPGPVISLNTGFPQPVKAGDRFYLVRDRSKGYSFREYRETINDVIADIRRFHPMATSAIVFPLISDYNEITILIPPDWSHYSGVEVRRGAGDGWNREAPIVGANAHRHGPYHGSGLRGPWIPVPRAMRRGDLGAHLIEGTRTVELVGHYGHLARSFDSSFRLIGARYPDQLDSDEEWTSIDPEWLSYQVASRLLLSGVGSDDKREGLGSYYQQQAEGTRGKAGAWTGMNAVPLPDVWS